MGEETQKITMFKVEDLLGRKKILDQYKVLIKTAVKDGKPYILSGQAGEVGRDPRSRGWNIVARTTFASKADMEYYDNECEAHKVLKMVAKPVMEDVMTLWYQDDLVQ